MTIKTKRNVGGRPVGMTAKASAARSERITAAFNKNQSYTKTAEKFGISYAAVYRRING